MGTVSLPLFGAFPWNLSAARGLRWNIFQKKSFEDENFMLKSMFVIQLQVQLLFINIFKNTEIIK